ncbi:MAG: hypothetical protein K0R54_217 [Clostridiaceae bacterium]|jgi:uncharacterized protein YwbE|nr:hypothetical protein [Clostridiaceae bacterium]
MDIDVTNKKNLCIGMLVDIIADEDRNTQNITRGYITEIITKDNRAKKISVILNNGRKGIVNHIITKDELKTENFKFYNLFFYDKNIYSIWDKKANKYLVIERVNKRLGNIERVAFLFNNDLIAKEILGVLDNKDYMIKTINRKKPIIENFKTLKIDFFNINKDRRLSYDRLIEWENKFKSMC